MVECEIGSLPGARRTNLARRDGSALTIRNSAASETLRVAEMGGSVGRIVGYMAVGAGVLLLSFWVTLTLIDSTIPADVALSDVPLTNDDGTPRAARPTAVHELPAAPTGFPFGVGWDNVEGLNVQVMGPSPVNSDNAALSLLATRDAGRHRLGLQLVGVPTNRPIRLTLWVKAPQGTRFNIDMRDGKSQNYGTSVFDAPRGTVLASNGNVEVSTQTGPADWVRVQLQTKTADGLVVLYLGLLNSSGGANFSGGGEQMIFGGIEFAPA
jgi:hypothetical protein